MEKNLVLLEVKTILHWTTTTNCYIFAIFAVLHFCRFILLWCCGGHGKKIQIWKYWSSKIELSIYLHPPIPKKKSCYSFTYSGVNKDFWQRNNHQSFRSIRCEWTSLSIAVDVSKSEAKNWLTGAWREIAEGGQSQEYRFTYHKQYD